MVRDIIDIDSTYEDFESVSDEDEEVKPDKKLKSKDSKKDESKKEEDQSSEDDEFNVSLAKNGRGDKTKNFKYFRFLK